MRKLTLCFIFNFITGFIFSQKISNRQTDKPDSIGIHKVVLDTQSKLIPWAIPTESAYDQFLHKRWNFIKTKVPNSPAPGASYPQYYFYCAFKDLNNVLEPDTWMNDVGEKIPNWFESARLYYAYTGDIVPLNIAKGMADYLLDHGVTSSSYSWPNFPQTGANAGDLEFRGFTSAKRFAVDDVQVDHAGDIGATYIRMYHLFGDEKYKIAAMNVADVLAAKVRPGNATQSPWPYVVNMNTGNIVSDYGSNWFGCILLFDYLIDAKIGNVPAYRKARTMARDWILKYPLQNGLWVDGHTDNLIKGTGNLSNMSASNAALYISDHPEFDPGWKINLPRLIKWTEDNFVFRGAPGEPPTQWGANIVGEQVDFIHKMDYQTARYAAQCARFYATSNDTAYKEKAYRSLNWVTYCSDSNGLAFESPLSKGILSWWSDSYGEGPRMFYHAFAAIPEWAPPGEDHILYSKGVLKNVSYNTQKVQYTATDKTGMEYIRLAFKPVKITLNGTEIFNTSNASEQGFALKKLHNGDYAVIIKRKYASNVIIVGSDFKR